MHQGVTWLNLMIRVAICVFMAGCTRQPASHAEEEADTRETLTPSALVNVCALVTLKNEIKGTGFFVTKQGESNAPVYFVTARHVAEDLTNSFALYPRLNLIVKRVESHCAAYADIPVEKVIGSAYWHQDSRSSTDLAIFPVHNYRELIEAGMDIRPVIFPDADTCRKEADNATRENGRGETIGYLSKEECKEFNVSAGYDVFMLVAQPELYKYTSGAEFLLVIRKGAISAMPHAFVRHKYGPARLIILDCPVMGGNSGGPVFVWVDEGKGLGPEPKLLGMVSAMLPDRVIFLPGTNRPFLENSGLSFVTPAEEVAEILRRF